MDSLNRIEIIGRLVNDPELRFSSDGKSVINFTIQVEKEKLINDSYFSAVIFDVKVLALGELADKCNQQLKNGQLIFLTGHLETKKVIQKEIVKDDEFGDYEIEYIEYVANIIAHRIKALEESTLEIEVNVKEKILEAIHLLDTTVYSLNFDKATLQALNILKGINLENLDS